MSTFFDKLRDHIAGAIKPHPQQSIKEITMSPVAEVQPSLGGPSNTAAPIPWTPDVTAFPTPPLTLSEGLMRSTLAAMQPTPVPQPAQPQATTDAVSAMAAQVNAYLPAVVAGVHIAQTVTSASNEAKKQAVIDSVLEFSQVAEGIPIPQVALIALLVNQTVSILKALGIFGHKKAVA
jgi:hypothetical protein